jgi:hypothetical protein
VIELNNVKIEAFPPHHLDSMRGLPNVSFILLDQLYSISSFPNWSGRFIQITPTTTRHQDRLMYIDDNISQLAAVNYRPMIRKAKANMGARSKSAKRESNK